MRVYYNDLTGVIDCTMNVSGTFEPPRLANHPFIETDMEMDDPTAWSVIGGQLVAVSEISPDLRAAADARVNLVIGRARALFITDTPGQQMTYLAKQTESKELLAMPAEPADPSIFPFLYAEIGITGPDITTVAQTVLNLAYQWGLLGSSMEKIRMGANAEIAAVTTRAELLTIQSIFKTNLGNLLASVGRSLEEIIHE